MKVLLAIMLGMLCYGNAAVSQEKTIKKSPFFKEAWKLAIPEGVKRIGIGDVMGDKKQRLILAETEKRLVIYQVTDTALQKEKTLESVMGAYSFEVGRFVQGMLDAIAVPGTFYYRENSQFVRAEAKDLKAVTGLIRYANGQEGVLQWETVTSEPRTFRFDPAMPNTLKPGPALLPPPQLAGIAHLVVLRGSAEFMEQIDAGGDFGKAGVVGSFDPYEDGRYYLWATKVTEGGSSFVISSLEGKPIWESPKLAGRVLDLAFGTDPKGNKQKGILFLLATGTEGKARLVQFFSLEPTPKAGQE